MPADTAIVICGFQETDVDAAVDRPVHVNAVWLAARLTATVWPGAHAPAANPEVAVAEPDRYDTDDADTRSADVPPPVEKPDVETVAIQVDGGFP